MSELRNHPIPKARHLDDRTLAMRALTGSAPQCRAEAHRLRTLAELVTTLALRQTLLDAAAVYDKLARGVNS
jgi:hypothetical protein